MKLGRLAVAACLLLVACGSDDGPGEVKLYDRAPVPGVPDRTAPVNSDSPAESGQYWAELVSSKGGDNPSVTFELKQAFFADTCIAELGAQECPNDFGTLSEPRTQFTTRFSEPLVATVVSQDQKNYAVTANELLSLLTGGTPAPEAPTSFAFVPFPFLITVLDGEVVAAHQIWMP